MVAEIITVGTEILMGQILNSNAQYLSQKLNELGINLYYQQTVGDNFERMVQSIALAASRSDVILLCGGLGPTADDITKWALAKYMDDAPMVVDQNTIEKLETFFKSKNYNITPNNFRQAEFPLGSEILENTAGTAPGCFAQFKEKSFFIMPGPPRELYAMFERSVEPIIKQWADNKRATRIVKIFGIGESLVEHQIQNLIQNQTNPSIAPYAKMLEVSLRITAQTNLCENPETLLKKTVDEICKTFGEAVYSTNDESLQSVVVSLLKAQNKTIAIAESLTGGLVCSKLVEISGVSTSLLEATVCYSDEAKIRLGVCQNTITEHTAVSEQTAKQMAQCVREKANADVGLSTTGFAGPLGKQVGLVYIGVSTKEKTFAIQINLSGNRERIRNAAALHALNQVRVLLMNAV